VAATLSLATAGAQEPPLTVDTEMLRWNDEIPGFGGFFYDEAGLPTVHLLDPENAGAARETFGADVQVRQGAWEFRQLAEWKSGLIPLLSLPGAVLLDIDEELNRLHIALDITAEDREANRERLERELLFSGVPREAVIVDEIEPAVPMQLLTDGFSPIPAGVHVAFANSFCTLGYNVQREATGEFGFLANSHCSRIQGQTEGTVYSQPAAPNAVAAEVHDPPFTAGPLCPPGRFCRYSDALFARYDHPDFGAASTVARTGYRGRYTGSLSTAQTPFRVGSVDIFPPVGSEVNKIGRTTGWTYGRVVFSCVDLNVASNNLTLYCQHGVQAGARPGDSGSPVFRWRGGKMPYVQAVGLLWGASSRHFYFSPILNLEAELGKLIFQ
ncbi:MAG TPA: hypothetical protein VJ725_27750, partial [Thermoanaerobaculia bacterium]|nr:hypothetical protein [Thermoanaerobaculia bacterium]